MQDGVEELRGQVQVLRDRLSWMLEVTRQMNESFDFETVLQGVLDSARGLTGSGFGVIVLFDAEGQVHDFLSSGMTAEQAGQLWVIPQGHLFLPYLRTLAGPLRVDDFRAHVLSIGLPEFFPPVAVTSFMSAPVHDGGQLVGNIYLARGAGIRPYNERDEEALTLFAVHAGLVIANARRHRDERRLRVDLETLVNTVPVGVVVLDARTGLAVSMNREARRIVSLAHPPDLSAEDLLEVAVVTRADGSTVSLGEYPLTEILRVGERVRVEEISLSYPGGDPVPLLLNATPVFDDGGELESFIVTLQELTALREAQRLRADFLAMVSHELRAPLLSIRGAATTLLEDASQLDPSEMAQFHRIIRDQSSYMRSLIGDLLDVARLETGALTVEPERSEVAVLLERARSAFIASGGRMVLEVDLPVDLPAVLADRRRLVQVLGNLLSNAQRHASESSMVRVEAGVRDGYVEVSISDRGPGIPRERLVELFRRPAFSSAAGGDSEGTGLGLSICRGIVEAHGGRIWAESDGPGRGACFTFSLPVFDGSTADHVVSGTGRGRVLVVDDDPEILRYVRDILARSGYSPVVTGDPQEALELVSNAQFELVLMDYMFPDWDGIDLMEELHRRVDVPVIFLSVYGREGLISRAFQLGAADYVVKPFSPTELTARIGAVVRRWQELGRGRPVTPFVSGDLSVDFISRSVTLAGQVVELTGIEYRLLSELALSAGEVVPHDGLYRRVWGETNTGGSGPLRSVVKRLRRKLGDDADEPVYIFTHPRVGYRMVAGDGLEQSPSAT